LKDLKKNKTVKMPDYNFSIHNRIGYKDFSPGKVIILEGIFALMKEFTDLLDLKVFIDADEEIRLNRRIKRDMTERGVTKEKVIKQWNKDVIPSHNKYVLPTRQTADVIIVNN
jgi:uridine kinase